ncbi:MAG: chaperone NapD [Candidatus Adiutrix sp.]|jgi:nitrate reductase NapAB chaperone NapD|nr:chaperone NapD [Candidatus Adiutrix sp.]
MAILGFLTHALADRVQEVEKALAAMPELTTYGIHQEAYVVAVANAPTEQLEALFDRVKALEGVLNVSVTSYNREDEEGPAPASDQLLASRRRS